MSHYGEFGCALWASTVDLVTYMLWATAANFVMRYGPLRRMKPYSKICDDFCTMGHSTGFGYGLWAIVQGLVIHYGS
jgi:hypothetical protein